MQKDTIIRFSVAIILFAFFACSKSEKKQIRKISDTENLSNFVSNSRIIRDSIKKMKPGNWELIICTQKKAKNHTVISFKPTCETFYIQHEYYYKLIDNANIIFYDYKKPLTNKKVQNGLERFIGKKIVKIEKSDRLCCLMPSYYFAYCNENPKIMSCFSFVMLIDREMEYRKKNKDMRNVKSSFYPKCN